MPDIFVDHPSAQPQRDSASSQPHEQPSPRLHQAHKLGFLSTFVRDPLGVELAEQHENEHILLFIRRDFITNVPWIFTTFVALIIPFFLPLLLTPFGSFSHLISQSLMITFLIFYYLIVLGFAFANFVTWFYDIGIVTEERAVDIDFYNISYVSVATARSQDLKDVRYAQKGFFQSLFDYGDVTLVVEASGEKLTFENTPRPAEVVSTLSALIGGHQE